MYLCWMTPIIFIVLVSVGCFLFCWFDDQAEKLREDLDMDIEIPCSMKLGEHYSVEEIHRFFSAEEQSNFFFYAAVLLSLEYNLKENILEKEDVSKPIFLSNYRLKPYRGAGVKKVEPILTDSLVPA